MGSDKATQALGAFVVGAVLLAAALFVAVTLMRGTRTDRSERYVPGPGPMLDPEVPIKMPKSWDAFYAFFG